MDTPETLAATIAAHAPGLSVLVLLIGGLGLGAVRSSQSLQLQWRTGLEGLCRRPILPGDGEALLFLLLLPHMLGAIAVLTSWGTVRPLPTGEELLLGAGVLQACLLAGISLVWMRHPHDRRELFGLTQVRPAHDLFNGMLLLLRLYPYLMLATLLALLLHRLGLPTAPQDAVRLLKSGATPTWVRVVLTSTAVITAPLLEEIIFRGLLLPACLKHQRPWVAIGLVSILFAAAHLNAASLLPLALLGTMLSIAYIRTGSLLVPIAMHTTYNAIQILIIMQMPPGA